MPPVLDGDNREWVYSRPSWPLPLLAASSSFCRPSARQCHPVGPDSREDRSGPVQRTSDNERRKPGRKVTKAREKDARRLRTRSETFTLCLSVMLQALQNFVNWPMPIVSMSPVPAPGNVDVRQWADQNRSELKDLNEIEICLPRSGYQSDLPSSRRGRLFSRSRLLRPR